MTATIRTAAVRTAATTGFVLAQGSLLVLQLGVEHSVFVIALRVMMN